jgi:chromosome segregation ATPase
MNAALYQVEALVKQKHVLERAVTQREEQITVLTTERDNWKARVQAAENAKDKSALQSLHHELQEKYSLAQEQLAAANRKVQQLEDFLNASTGDLGVQRRRLQEAQLGREDAEARLAIVSKELELLQQAAKRRDADLQNAAREASELRLANEDLNVALQGVTARYEAAQRLQSEAHALLEAKSAELAEVSHDLALARAGSTSSFGGSDVEAQLREDRRRLQDRVRDLEAAQVM